MNDPRDDAPTDDPLLTGLRAALPALDLDTLAAERLRRRAHAALARGAPWPAWRRGWRAIEPALALGLAASALFWVSSTVLPYVR